MSNHEESGTKTKEDKKNGWFCLSCCWVIFLTLFIMLCSEYSYTRMTGSYYKLLTGRSLLSSTGIIGVIYLIILSIFTCIFLKRHPLAPVIKERRIDRWCPELVLVGIIGIMVIVWSVLPLIHSVRDIYVTLAGSLGGSLLCAILLYGGIVLLIRKSVLKLTRSTSVFLWEYERHRNQTALELKIKRRYRIYWVLIYAFVILGSILGIVQLFDESLSGILWWYIVSMGILVVLLVYTSTRNQIIADAGRLVLGIEKLSESMEAQELVELPEESMFYEASCRLLQIKKRMDENVEKQVQAERMKIELITNVSHDLKTPLTSMIGYTELLKKEELSPAARDYADIISDKQEKLADMIQDVFELSKATSNSEKLNIEVLDMNKLVEQIMTDMEDVLKGCEFTYVKRFAEVLLLFCGDNTKMYRVVQNILENTVKYSLVNTRVFVETEASGGIIKLKVKNIASYEMDFQAEEIVERFTRGDKARTSEGHGLGLAIASGLLGNMGGRLYVETDGDLFKVVVEMKEVSDNNGIPVQESAVVTEEQG